MLPRHERIAACVWVLVISIACYFPLPALAAGLWLAGEWVRFEFLGR